LCGRLIVPWIVGVQGIPDRHREDQIKKAGLRSVLSVPNYARHVSFPPPGPPIFPFRPLRGRFGLSHHNRRARARDRHAFRTEADRSYPARQAKVHRRPNLAPGPKVLRERVALIRLGIRIEQTVAVWIEGRALARVCFAMPGAAVEQRVSKQSFAPFVRSERGPRLTGITTA